IYFIFFFFSSRRRHTRSKRDWSSDVCSSDLITSLSSVIAHQRRGSVVWSVVFLMGIGAIIGVAIGSRVVSMMNNFILQLFFCVRSEERRVGKEGGVRWWGVCVKRRE